MKSPERILLLYLLAGAGCRTKVTVNGKKYYDRTRYLTTVDEIEELTGFDFLTTLPNAVEKKIERPQATKLWDVDKSDLIEACRKVR